MLFKIMKDCVKKCLGQIIVSCQAYEDTPLYGAENIKKMVECAVMGGANVVRCCWPENIKAAREVSKELVIIGIDKVGTTEEGDRSEVFITPSLEAVDRIVEAGCDIVGLDCRLTPKRGKRELQQLLEAIHKKYPSIGVMADCETYEDAKFAAESGLVDIVSTTLSGLNKPEMGIDTELVEKLKSITSLPINGEGRVWELSDISAFNDAGADMITIGSAITRPHLITKRFIDCYDKVYNQK